MFFYDFSIKGEGDKKVMQLPLGNADLYADFSDTSIKISAVILSNKSELQMIKDNSADKFIKIPVSVYKDKLKNVSVGY